jgi:hypothetical protein
MTRNTIIFLLLASVFLTACGGVEFNEPTSTSFSPPAVEINAAAERAAEAEGTAVNASKDEKQEALSNELQPTQSAEEAAAAQPAAQPATQRSEAEQPAAQNPTAETIKTDVPEESQPVTNRRVEVGEFGRILQLLPYDGIRPVYEPVFAPAAEAPLDDSELIIGIAFDDEAKAYPISVLRFREMVNDELAGIPTLVTW